MKKQFILYTILLAPFFSIGQSDNYVIFPVDFKLNCFSIDSSYNRFTPSDSEVNYADSLARSFILTESSKLTINGDRITNFNQYKKQYFGFKNEADEKIVLINAFHNNNSFIDNWKEEIVCVKGGGANYLQIKVNIDKNKQFDFWINAPK